MERKEFNECPQRAARKMLTKICLLALLLIAGPMPFQAQVREGAEKSDSSFAAGISKAHTLFLSGNFPAGKIIVEENLQNQKKEYGEKSPDYALSLDYISRLYYSLNQLEEAILLEAEASSILSGIIEKGKPEESIAKKHAIILHNWASYLFANRQYTLALEKATASLALKEDLHGKCHEEYYVTLCLLRGINASLDKPIAYEQTKQLKDLAANLYGKESIDYLKWAEEYYFGVAYAKEQDYEKTINGLEECVQILDKTDNKDFLQEKIYALDGLALVYLAGRDYKNAAHYYMRTLEIIDKEPSADSKFKTELLTSLARCQAALSKYGEADSLLRAAYHIEVLSYGETTDHACNILENIALNHYYKSEYRQSIELYKKSLSIRERMSGKDLHYARILCLLGDCYRATNNGELFSQTMKTAASLVGNVDVKQISEKQKILYAGTLLAFCDYCIVTEDLAQAEAHLRQAIAIYEQDFLTSEGSRSEALAKLAFILNRRGDRQGALKAMENSINIIYNDGKSQNTTAYAGALRDYADLLLFGGHTDDARKCYLHAYEIFRKNLGDESEESMTVCQRLASLHYAIKDYGYAAGYAIRLMENLPKVVRRQFHTMTSAERSRFWKKFRFEFEDLVPRITYESQHPEMLKAAYNCCLLSKGLLLNTEQEMRSILLESEDKGVIALYDSLLSARKLLEGTASLPENKRLYTTEALKERIDRIERKLIGESKVYGDFTRNMGITWKDVQNSLEDKDIAVEFLKFPLRNDTTGYGALILKKGYEHPRYVNCLGILPGSRLNKKERDTYGDTWMPKAIWRHIYGEMKDVENIYFSPTGELYNIAIESLQDLENPERRMSDRWRLFRLSSTRELALSKERHTAERATVYGGLQYDVDEAFLFSDNQASADKRSIIPETVNIADSLNLRSGVQYLPATKNEAEDICKALSDMRIKSTLYTDRIGTERSFKALSGKSPDILHIATHGFYWTEQEAKRMNRLDFLRFNEASKNNTPDEDKALTRSGLLLSGANHSLTGGKLPENVDDGILTAKEISMLDLTGLDLAVLSACQTGLGEITGEGVFGLQRGFKKAGAKSLLMSLWKVDDRATKILMTQFYANLAKGKSKAESLREAQRYVREYTEWAEIENEPRKAITAQQKQQAQTAEKKHKQIRIYEHPKYWAAFILLDAIDPQKPTRP